MRKVLVMMDELVKDDRMTQTRFVVKNRGQIVTVTLDKGDILNPQMEKPFAAVDTSEAGLVDAGHTGVRG